MLLVVIMPLLVIFAVAKEHLEFVVLCLHGCDSSRRPTSMNKQAIIVRSLARQVKLCDSFEPKLLLNAISCKLHLEQSINFFQFYFIVIKLEHDEMNWTDTLLHPVVVIALRVCYFFYYITLKVRSNGLISHMSSNKYLQMYCESFLCILLKGLYSQNNIYPF